MTRAFYDVSEEGAASVTIGSMSFVVKGPNEAKTLCELLNMYEGHAAELRALAGHVSTAAFREHGPTVVIDGISEIQQHMVQQKVEVTRAHAILQYLVDWCDGQGLLEDHSFTFPDGTTVEADR